MTEEQEQEQKTILNFYWFTWGWGQGHDQNYTIIEAPTWISARRIMYSIWGDRWCGQYIAAEVAGIKEFALKPILTDRSTPYAI